MTVAAPPLPGGAGPAAARPGAGSNAAGAAADRSSAGPGDAPSALTHLLYLHGFRSSPQSFKARWMADWMARQRPDVVWACPQLPPSPAEALAGLRALTADWPAAGTGVIGSSLGGFYATVLVEERGFRAVVINPAVAPARDLGAYIGRQTLWHAAEQSFEFRPEYVDELRQMTPGAQLAHPGRVLALVAKGDEVLDWREMAARYGQGPLTLIAGSDHGLGDFARHVPGLLAHLGLDGAAPAAAPAGAAPAA